MFLTFLALRLTISKTAFKKPEKCNRCQRKWKLIRFSKVCAVPSWRAVRNYIIRLKNSRQDAILFLVITFYVLISNFKKIHLLPSSPNTSGGSIPRSIGETSTPCISLLLLYHRDRIQVQGTMFFPCFKSKFTSYAGESEVKNSPQQWRTSETHCTMQKPQPISKSFTHLCHCDEQGSSVFPGWHICRFPQVTLYTVLPFGKGLGVFD